VISLPVLGVVGVFVDGRKHLLALERKAPKHALPLIRDDFHRIVYAANTDAARVAYTAFERIWTKRCPGVATSLRLPTEDAAVVLLFTSSRVADQVALDRRLAEDRHRTRASALR
jgi:transposase-like protein